MEVETLPRPERQAPPDPAPAEPPSPAEPPAHWSVRWFWPILGGIVAVAAAIRLSYVLTDDRSLFFPGVDYHLGALRLADGLGYTVAFGPHVGGPDALHPPGWVTLLGAVSWLGARTPRDHQLVGVALGLVLVVLIAMVGRRYFDARAGLIAAVIAAIYPGFWLLEGNMLSEPLDLVLLGVLTLLVADLPSRPTWWRSVVIGAVCGLLALTRAEQLALVVVVVVPLLLAARSLPLAQRFARIAVVASVCVAMIAPWAVYNTSRFNDTVILSTSGGDLLLLGNCDPGSFHGERMGYGDIDCLKSVMSKHPTWDGSQIDAASRGEALSNARANIRRLPVAVPARIGRMIALFRPSQTVAFVAQSMTVETRLVWFWVASFWVVLVLAIAGTVTAARDRRSWWPLVAPVAVSVFVVAISYGEPRFHAPADLGLIVLAGFAVSRSLRRPPGGGGSIDERAVDAAPTDSPGRPRAKRSGRLPSVHVPR